MKKYFLVLVLSITFLLSVFEAFAANTWTVTGSMNSARGGHAATLLPNGKVLVVGGYHNGTYLNSAELYDPITGIWTNTGSLNIARTACSATVLPNGKVLVVGGENTASYPKSGNYPKSAELYDPITGTWTLTGSLNTEGRIEHAATLLPNGKVLVAGGRGGTLDSYSSAELYDPATGTWAITGSFNTARGGYLAVLLPNSKVLAIGGRTHGFTAITNVELYDPVTGSWTNTGSLVTKRYGGVSTLLTNGKVLVAGGYNYDDSHLTSSEIYDLATSRWIATKSMNARREGLSGTLLPNGKFLVAGGYNSSGSLASAEIYDSTTGTWAGTGTMNIARAGASATLLSNGKVLVAGGDNAGISAELYDPGIAPPIVREVTKAGIEDAELTFATSDFTNHFSDPSSGSLTKVKVTSLPTHGTLKLSETDVTANQEIPVANLNNLKFIPETNWNGTTSFNWNGSNGTEYAVTPAKVNITIEATEDRPILGMVSKSGTEGNTITFSASDFSHSFIDPDGYGLKKIKITSLPDCYGSLKLLNEEVKEGDEILINYLENLTFVPDPNWKGGTITFNWNGSNGKLYAIRDGEVSITITDNSWWKPWIGGGVIGAATAVGAGYLTYKVNKYCHRHDNDDRLLTGETPVIEMNELNSGNYQGND